MHEIFKRKSIHISNYLILKIFGNFEFNEFIITGILQKRQVHTKSSTSGSIEQNYCCLIAIVAPPNPLKPLL